jgi:MFS family permease
LFSALAEGAAADWGGVLLKEQWQTSPLVTSLPYIFFSATMVLGRLTGDHLTDRFGRANLLSAGGLISGLGLLTGLIIGGPFGITLGWALLGAGVSVAIPTVFSTAAQIASTTYPAQVSPAQAVAGVSGIAYAGFLLGPPVIGALAQISSLRIAMGLPALLTLGLALASPFIKSSQS